IRDDVMNHATLKGQIQSQVWQPLREGNLIKKGTTNQSSLPYMGVVNEKKSKRSVPLIKSHSTGSLPQSASCSQISSPNFSTRITSSECSSLSTFSSSVSSRSTSASSYSRRRSCPWFEGKEIHLSQEISWK